MRRSQASLPNEDHIEILGQKLARSDIGSVADPVVRKTLTLHAPVSAVVMEKDVFEGQAFQPGANLYIIADLTEVWVNAEVFEADAALVRAGMPAEVTVAALPWRAFSATIEYVYPTLQDRTRSMRA